MLKKLNKKKSGIYTSVELYACWCQCPYYCQSCNCNSEAERVSNRDSAVAIATAGSNGDQVVANA